MYSLALILVCMAQPPREEVSAAQFSRLIEAAFAGFRDVSFSFEGGTEFVGRGVAEDAAHAGDRNFQGTYSFRSDGATRLESYHKGEGIDDRTHHTVWTVIDRALLKTDVVADLGRMSKSRSHGGEGVLNMPGSPERIFRVPYLLGIKDPVRRGYEFQGWETVDGHRCLRVQFLAVEGSNAPPERRSLVRLWIDLARGGHPLRVDFLKGENLRFRIDSIRLQEVPVSEGASIWFPVYGEVGTYEWEGSYLDNPIDLEKYNVISGTLRYNEGLDPALFDVARRAQAKRQFAPRADPAAARTILEKALGEARDQAKALDASSSSEGSWLTGIVGRFGLLAPGPILIGIAIVWRLRRNER